MYKRRDWLHLQGQDGSGSEGSSEGTPSSSAAAEKQNSSSLEEEDDATSSDQQEGSLGDAQPSRRLEDLSEDDFDSEPDSEAEKLAEALEEQMRSWADPEQGKRPPGRPLRCRLCPRILMLGPDSYRKHLASSKHIKRVALISEPMLRIICFAEDMTPEEAEMETHEERAARVATLALKPTPTQRRKKRGRPNAAGKGIKAKKRPGKRQRAEAKAAGTWKTTKKAKAGQRAVAN